VAKRTDRCAAAFLSPGLVSLGKSALPELGLTATTEPLAFGPCKNPWATDRSAGGSSGGAAALVAAGVVPIAHGSDGGGSIRIPASVCGLVGLKPSRGRFDMDGSPLLPVNIAVHGVLSRTVRDTAAFWRAIEAHARPSRMPPVGAAGERPARRQRIAVFVDSPLGHPVDGEVVAAVERAARLLRELGHEVREISCPVPRQVLDDFVSLWAYVAWVQTGMMVVANRLSPSKLEPLTRGFMKKFTGRVAGSLREVKRLRGWAAQYERLFDGFKRRSSGCAPTLPSPACSTPRAPRP
jgi:amidase